MRAIDRAAPPASLEVLTALVPSAKWDSSGRDLIHTHIRAALFVAQGGLCAYCERPLSITHLCIEHIHPRAVTPCNVRPSGDYDWDNLFAVCGSQETCDGPSGKAGRHLCGDIAFPDEFVAPQRLVDVNPANGKLIARHDLAHDEAKRIEKALETLNLNCETLNGQRKQVLVAIDQMREAGDSVEQIRFDVLGWGFASVVESILE